MLLDLLNTERRHGWGTTIQTLVYRVVSRVFDMPRSTVHRIVRAASLTPMWAGLGQCTMHECSDTAHCTGGQCTLLQGTLSWQTEVTHASDSHSPSSLPTRGQYKVCTSFNVHHSRARSIIERAFGMMKTRFRAIFPHLCTSRK